MGRASGRREPHDGRPTGGQLPKKKCHPRLGIEPVEVAARILLALITACRLLPLKDLAKLAHMHLGKAHATR